MPHKRIDPVIVHREWPDISRKLIAANNILDSWIIWHWEGLWNTDARYKAGSVVTDGTDMWLALRDNTGTTPIEGDDWTLVFSESFSSRAFAMFIS